MATITWKGASGDWTTAADWGGGVVPGAADTVDITGGGAYALTLYGAAAAGNVLMDAPAALFYDAGTLSLGGTFTLQAGTFALAYGSLQGGTLALAGGRLEALGGTLDGVTVQGPLDLSAANATLFVRDGLTLAGAGGIGPGSLTLTGNNAALDFIGSQSLANATVAFGVAAAQGQGGASVLGISHGWGATAGATLTLGSSLWLRETGTQAIIEAGGALPSPYTDTVVNGGTITSAIAGATLTLAGGGSFSNQGLIGVSNGATLDIAVAGFSNTGSIVVNNATLALDGTFASSRLAALGPLTLTAGTVEIAGTAENAGATLSVSAGSALGPIALAGTIAGGTVTDAGGGLSFRTGTGVLDGVSYVGTAVLGGVNAALTLDDGTTLATAGGGAGQVTVSGAGAALLLQGTTTLDHATISLGSSVVAAILGTTDPFLAPSATAATLGANLLVQQIGRLATIDANGTEPIAGYGLADTVLSEGTITAGFAGGTFTIGGAGIFINQGDITVSNGDTLLADAALFSNTGTLAVTGGATAVLGAPATAFGTQPAWSNTGLISVNGGTLVLAGAIQTGQLGVITDSGGLVTLAATLANAGSTLAVGSGGIVPALTLTGTIVGGTIADAGAALSIGAGATALLDGVTYQGTLGLASAGAYLRVRDGLTLAGAAAITGAGATLAFQGTEIFDSAQVTLGAAGQAASIDVLHDYGASGGTTLTLGAALAITQAGALAFIGNAGDLSGDAIVSYARIAAATAGGIFSLAGAGFTNFGSIGVSNGDTLCLMASNFSNFGTIAITNAALAIDDSMTLASLGRLALSNAAVSLGGTLNATGGTLALGAGSLWGRLALSGTVHGGTILDGGGGLSATGNATLDGVAYRGALDLSRPFQSLTVTGGISLTDITGTQPGTILLTGAASKLTISGNETIDNASIYIGSATQTYYGQHIPPPELAAGPGSTLIIGAHALVRSAGLVGWLGDCSVGRWTDAVINDGTILAASANGILTIGSSFFTNDGGVAIGAGGNVLFGGVSFFNGGNISLNAGSSLMLSLYSYYAAPNSGPTLLVDPGCVLELGGAVGAGQTVSFAAAGETLRLDTPAMFAAHVAGYATGDVIDIAGATVNTIAISAGTLVAGTSYGQFRLAATAPLAGEISVGADAHGGDTIAITQQTIGSAPVVIAASQPNMLFWASPAGDVFEGTAAHLAGARIGNWSSTDSLDFIDLLGTQTRVSYAQGTGQGTLTVTDGVHTDNVLLIGSYTASWFQVSSDVQGHAVVSYI